mgnify:CR=1 FL=1
MDRQERIVCTSAGTVGTGWLPPWPDLRDYTTDRPEIAEMLRGDPDRYQSATRHTSSPLEIPHIGQNADVLVRVSSGVHCPEGPGEGSRESGDLLLHNGLDGVRAVDLYGQHA